MPQANGQCRDPSRPPLPCRASPPQGGRSAIIAAFANRQRCRMSGAPKLLISPLVRVLHGSRYLAHEADGRFLKGARATL
ncbi:hypothetical protein FJ567_27220, partial [Mesorhizobium sp. B2-4-16]